MLLLIWGMSYNYFSRKSQWIFPTHFPYSLAETGQKWKEPFGCETPPHAPKSRAAPSPLDRAERMVLAYWDPRGAQCLGMWAHAPHPSPHTAHTASATPWITATLGGAGCCETVAGFILKHKEVTAAPQTTLFHLRPHLPRPPSAQLSVFRSYGCLGVLDRLWVTVSHTPSPETRLQEAPALGLHRRSPGQVLLAPGHVSAWGGWEVFPEAPGAQAGGRRKHWGVGGCAAGPLSASAPASLCTE